MKDNLGFELYEIKKENEDIFFEKQGIVLNEEKIEKIKNHIITFFEKKNSFYKHMEKDSLPKNWTKAFSNPINDIFNISKNNKPEFDLLLDSFLKQGLSPQSFSFSRRSKFLLVIYKKGEYFILSHLSVKSGLTLEKNSIELSKLLFYSDTLLRYIYISSGIKKKFDIVFWEKQLTKKFIEFLGVSDHYLNKEYSGELMFYCEKSFYSPTITFEPSTFLEKYLNKEITIEKLNFENYLILENDRFKIKKVKIGDTTLKKVSELGNELFLIKTSINTSIRKKLSNYEEISNLSLPFDVNSLTIIEKINTIEVGEDEIIKNNNNFDHGNIINFGLSLKNITINNSIDFEISSSFAEYILSSLFLNSDKKTILFSLYDKYKIDFLNKDFVSVYNNLGVYFLNLTIDENIKINEELTDLKQYIEKSDSNIIKELYKLISLKVIYSHLVNHANLLLYFNELIKFQINEIAKIKGLTFSESENGFIEYKSGLCVNIDKSWNQSIKSLLKGYIEIKSKSIRKGFICIGFDEKSRIINGISDKYFKKFTDDSIFELEEYLKANTDIDEIRFYKIAMGSNNNILLIYIGKH